MTRKLILTLAFAAFSSQFVQHVPIQAKTSTKPHSVTQGELLAQDATGRLRDLCPLKHTEVKAAVSGFLTRVTVTQEFQNPYNEKIEAVYVFPLSQNAAVDDMTMQIGNRTVRGLIKPREEARAIYEQARTAGKTASLLDQERPNIFTQSVANIPPGEPIKVIISYVETLKYEDGAYEFVFPMVVGPRYIPQAEAVNDSTTARETNRVPDAERLASPVLPEGLRPGHDISIEVIIDAGVPIEDLQSKLHDVNIERNSARAAVVSLKDKDTIPNRDFILKLDVAGSRIEDALLAHRTAKGGYFTLMLQPPDRIPVEDVTPKELVFVLDTSGSMDGLPIEMAKRSMKLALDSLYPQDTFNLITFAGDTNILFDGPVPASKENLKKAREFLESRKGGGGTEMMKAIRAALSDSDNQNHIRIVCFMTDGYVGNDLAIIEEIKKHSQARVFSFGIGNSVNRFLLDKMAEYGRGEVEYVPINRGGEQDAKTAASAAKRFHERIRTPLLTDVSVDWGELPVADVYPKHVPDLFGARPLTFCGRYTSGARGVIRLRGNTIHGEFVREIPVELPALQPHNDVLATLWARKRIDVLMAEDFAGIQRNQPREEIKQAITQLGLEYRLMTQFTSFVAVEETPSTSSGEPRRIDVPVAIPDGVNYQTTVGNPMGMYSTLSVSTETVTVTSSSVSSTVYESRLDNLPLNGRSFTDLGQLAPGTMTACLQTQPRRDTPELIAGLPDVNTSLTINGGDATNAVTGGSLPTPATAAIQEIRIATTSATADQGRLGPAAISLVTKSGTNSWRGSAMFLGRSGNLSALPATFDRAEDKPSFHREQYDGTLGGPVWKDNLFIFGAFSYRNQQGLMQVGERDEVARTIRQRFLTSPLSESLGTSRADWRASDRDDFNLLYSTERGENVSSSILSRTIGSTSQLQAVRNEFDAASLRYTRTLAPTLVNEFRLGFNRFRNASEPIQSGLQLNFPSLQDGAAFRVPSVPRQNRWQLSDSMVWINGPHTFTFGGEAQHINAAYDPGFGANGLVEFAEDFAGSDRNGDGRIDDRDLQRFFTLRPVLLDPQRQAALDNSHVAAYAQDQWRLRPSLTLSFGLRWQFDTNEKNLHSVDKLNPLTLPFLTGKRGRDLNNVSPRVSFSKAIKGDRVVVRGGYGIFYDRIPLQFAALEQTLDGRRTAFGVYTGASADADPFAGITLAHPASPGIHILDNALQNPMVQQFSLGVQHTFADKWTLQADVIHSFATHLPVGRTAGLVLNPATELPDRIIRLESAAKAKYDALLVGIERRATGRSMLRAYYTVAKSFNYTNGDQLPFFAGIIDPDNLRLEYGPAPTDQRHRFGFAGDYEPWRGWRAAAIWTIASGLPMNILLPDASSRVPLLQRNAGGRLFHTGAELNQFLRQLNSAGGINGTLLPLVRDEAQFNDSFQSFDLRLSKEFRFGGEARLEVGGELFNLFNVTNFVGVSSTNPTGYANALTRDRNIPGDAGFLQASSFGRPMTAAGGMFGPGGPRAVQVVVKFKF